MGCPLFSQIWLIAETNSSRTYKLGPHTFLDQSRFTLDQRNKSETNSNLDCFSQAIGMIEYMMFHQWFELHVHLNFERYIVDLILQVVHAPYAMQWQVFPAPEPREIVWNNLSQARFTSGWSRQFIVYIIVFMTVLFYMIPIALISSLTTLENLVKILPFIKVIVNFPPLNSVLQVTPFFSCE